MRTCVVYNLVTRASNCGFASRIECFSGSVMDSPVCHRGGGEGAVHGNNWCVRRVSLSTLREPVPLHHGGPLL